MIRPFVQARIEERNLQPCLRINCSLFVGPAAIARETGKSKNLEFTFATVRDGDCMIHRETNILPTLVGVTVFAEEFGSQANSFLQGFGNFTGHELNPAVGQTPNFVSSD